MISLMANKRRWNLLERKRIRAMEDLALQIQNWLKVW